jgi:hypothetical protein
MLRLSNLLSSLLSISLQKNLLRPRSITFMRVDKTTFVHRIADDKLSYFSEELGASE